MKISSLIMDCIEDKVIYQNVKEPIKILLSQDAYDKLVEEVKGITNFEIPVVPMFAGYPVDIDEFAEGIKIVVY